MIDKFKIPIEKLKNKIDLSKYDFKTTEDLKAEKNIIGQKRGVDSFKFGLSIKRKGYNIYTSGESGTGRTIHSHSLAKEHAKSQETPKDILYVYNFDQPNIPKMIKLKAGRGKAFKESIERSIKNLREDSEDMFYSYEYEEKKKSIYKYFQSQKEEIIEELNIEAKQYNFMFEKIDEGLISVPLFDGKALRDEEIDLLPEEEIQLIKENSKKLETKTTGIIRKLKKIEDDLEEQIISIEKEILRKLVDQYLQPVAEQFSDNKSIKNYIEQVKKDIEKNADEFIVDDLEEEKLQTILERNNLVDNFFKRYKVNLFIDNSCCAGSPVINETDPSYYNLFGKIEHYNEMGFLKTDHSRIKPGSIHRANGGYLLVKARELITNSRSWDVLKRCIRTEKSKIENMSKENTTEESITPEPIDLDLKIILIGDEYTYQLLYTYDDYFKKLFKIKVDFEDEMERSEDNIKKILSFITRYSEDENMLAFSRCAIEEIIEYSSRSIENQNKLTTKLSDVLELMYEGDTWARVMGSYLVKSEHIKKAIYKKVYRNNKYQERLEEMISSGLLMIDIEGERIGEINGLAVVGLGEYAFGKPTKITASTFIGKDGIINVEREVGKSGDCHDKGMFILGGFIGEEFAKLHSLSLTASLAFEQSYGSIDGDSASSTELYALLSSLADLPIKQSIATTGSINQKGRIQAIGGVNEKIEGFYKICKSKGLTGEQGVIIPFQNIENLMLSEEVIEAVEKDLFHIYQVRDVKEGIEILTGVKYGQRDRRGKFEKDTIGYLIDEKLKRYSKST